MIKLDAIKKWSSSPLFESVLTGIGGQVFLLVSGVLVARQLGPDGRGTFALLILIPSILVQLGLIGLPQSVTHFIAKKHDITHRKIKDLLTIMLIQCIVVTGIYLVVYVFYLEGKSTEVSRAGLVVLLTIPGNILMTYGLAGIQGLQTYRVFNILRTVLPFMWSISAVGMIYTSINSLFLFTFAWSLLTLIAGVFIFSYLLMKLFGQVQPDASSFYERKLYLGFGLRGMLGYISPLNSFRLDQLILGIYCSPSVLGIYVVSQAFVNLPRFVAQSLGMVAFSQVSAENNQLEKRSRISRYFLMLSFFTIPIVVVIYIFVPVLIDVLYGQDFNESIVVVRILLFGAIFTAYSKVFAEIFRGYSKPGMSSRIDIYSYPLLILGSFLLIPKFGAIGMSVIVSVVGFVLLLLTAYLWHQEKKMTRFY